MKIKPVFPKVNNVKAHLKLSSGSNKKTLLDELKELNSIRHNNYFIVREEKDKIVYSIFPRSGFVNITGVKNFDEIEKAVAIFNKKFKQNISVADLTTDNSTASGRIADTDSSRDIQINLEHIKFIIDTEPDFGKLKASLSPANFPGIVIRSKNCPTCLIFTSGRFIIVGAKRKQDISTAYAQLCVIIEKYTKMFQMDMFIA